LDAREVGHPDPRLVPVAHDDRLAGLRRAGRHAVAGRGGGCCDRAGGRDRAERRRRPAARA
jgi:hypothetical protein